MLHHEDFDTVHDALRAGNAEEVRLIEHDRTGTATPNDDRHPVQEIER